VPVGFGRAVLVPLLATFAELDDELTMDVELSDRGVDLADEGVDVVIWSSHRRDSSVVAKKLCHVDYVTVASPQGANGRTLEPERPVKS
jgi:DNA-binding transcriptional LysR family regulator